MAGEQIEQRYIETLSIPEKAIKDIPVLRDDYTFNKLKQYLISHGIRIQEETFYKNFGLCTSDGKFKTKILSNRSNFFSEKIEL